MSNRDEFSKTTKQAVAARASWLCSFTGCSKLTVGPGEESLESVTNIGIAAHIAAAAPGRGARRYDASMTPEERSDISNAIWLCSNHAVLIDRDEITYTAEILRAMKRDHEITCARALRTGSTPDHTTNLLAIGPNVVCAGDLTHVVAGSWTLHLRHFLIGDIHKTISFIDDFSKEPLENRYILSNELGDGRVLNAAPSLTKEANGYHLHCNVAPSFQRIDAQNLASDLALHPDTGDLLFGGNGDLAIISGLDALPQKVRALLSMQQNESVHTPNAGARFFEYFTAFRGSPWLDLLPKLDVIRQASVPFRDYLSQQQHTPLQCVTRVHSVELLVDNPTGNSLPVRVEFEVQGVGMWQRELSIYMPTVEEVTERAEWLATRAGGSGNDRDA